MQAIDIALTQYGVKGIPGAVDNPIIEQYFKDIGAGWVTDDETAWCACFMNWCLMKAGKAYSSKLNARSFLGYGVETKTPKTGDIVVFWRISPTSGFGHVGFYVSTNSDGTINVLGGNQDNQVSIKTFTTKQILGYRSI